ncbi:MAG: HAD-IB family hydrolase [Luteolibacter sp.]
MLQSVPPNIEFPDQPPAKVAIFDLDGTLIAWDCQLLFRHFVVRKEPWRIGFVIIFLLLAPLAKLLGTETMKRVFLSYLWGIDECLLEEYASEFADQVMPAIYPEVKAMLDGHRQSGDFTVLTSASPEIYVKEIGKRLGFDLALGTLLESRHLFPNLVNHKGRAKVHRLQHILPPSWFDGETLHAKGYTDSIADLPMLELCDEAVCVNPGERLSDIAKQKEWAIVRPERPWTNLLGKAWRVLALLLGVCKDPGGLTKP